MKNDCTIVILSFNVKDITDKSLQDAEIAVDFYQKQTGNSCEIVVVDNGSSDKTVEMIRKKYKNVTLVALPKNMGVSYGYNIGMKQAKTPYILLINSDTLLKKSTIVDAMFYMNTHPNCDVATGEIITPNERFRGIGGYLPSPFKTIRWLLGFESMPFFSRFLKRIYGDTKDYTKEQVIEWVPTCFFFLRKTVFEKTHGHDEEMFLYMEDLEWCKRIHDEGMTICYTPSIQAVHLGGASTSKKSETSYLFLLQRNIDGLRYYHNKHHPKTLWLIDVCLMLGNGIRGFFYTLSNNKIKAFAYKQVILKDQL
ncbi:MAG TPA: glycosyltransferase family 2 protein [Methylomirabilota bacterium]|nr:glycosyltransferase family 2 protein [Methylomirabilota bacterium]